jgi:hypothetical protein
VSETLSSFSFTVGADEFTGKGPLYDYFIAVLNHIERGPERHTGCEDEDEAGQGSRVDALKGRMQQLESLTQQRLYDYE